MFQCLPRGYFSAAVPEPDVKLAIYTAINQQFWLQQVNEENAEHMILELHCLISTMNQSESCNSG